MGNDLEYVYQAVRDTEYKYKILECIDYIERQEYGTTLEKEKLAEMLGFNIEITEEDDKFKEKMARIKNVLIEKGIVLKTISGVGYYILKPKQVSGYVYHRYVRSIDRILAKGKKILKYTPKIDLSNIRKQEIDNLIDLNMDLIVNNNNTIENSEYWKHKEEYDNLEDD